MIARSVVALGMALMSAGCAYPMLGASPFVPPPRHQMRAPAAAPVPVGRWDNVMMQEPGTPLRVLTLDGVRIEGRFHSATSRVLRLADGDDLAEIGMTEVVRVDRLRHFGRGARDEAVWGAAVGTGTVGVIGLLAGRMPPPRLWAAGALVGGYAGAQAQIAAAGPGTIYLAEWRSPPPEAAVR